MQEADGKTQLMQAVISLSRFLLFIQHTDGLNS